jgi:hypothetical protein
MAFMVLSPRPGGEPPVPFLLLFVPLFFLAVSWLTNKLMGIDALYRDWPADREDPIDTNLGWQQVEFGALRGHCPMSIKLGQRCLHLKQPFPFQPFWWRGPGSVPWGEVLLEKEPSESRWAFLSVAEFRLGREGRMIRLRGKAGRALAAEVRRRQAPPGPGHGPVPPVVRPEAIRPR